MSLRTIRHWVILPCMLLNGPLRPSLANDGSALRDALVPLEVEATVEVPHHGAAVLSGRLTGVCVRDKQRRYILAPSYFAHASFALFQNRPLLSLEWFHVVAGKKLPVAVAYVGPEISLLALSTDDPCIDAATFRDYPADVRRVTLLKYGQRACVVSTDVCPLVDATPTARTAYIPACPYYHDWLGALCVSEDGTAVYGILSSFSNPSTPGLLYNYQINNVSTSLLPDGHITLLDDREIRFLLAKCRQLEYSRLEWLGMHCDLQPAGSTEAGESRLVVRSVRRYSLASNAGFAAGDVITKVDGNRIQDRQSRFPVFLEREQLNEGDSLSFEARRGDQVRHINVRVPHPDALASHRMANVPIRVARAYLADRGSGVCFEIVSLGKGAEDMLSGIRLGDVILAVNGKPVRSLDMLGRALCENRFELTVLRDGVQLRISGKGPK